MQFLTWESDGTMQLLGFLVLLRGDLFSRVFSSFIYIFGTSLNCLIICACASSLFDQGQPQYVTDIENTELFDFGEEMKFGIVSDFVLSQYYTELFY